MIARVSIALLALALHACCMDGSSEERSATDPSAPSEPSSAEPPVLILGAPPITIEVPAAPRFALTLDRPGEYAIDLDGAPANAQLRLFAGESVVMQAGDGAATAAHVETFLDRGNYAIQASEWRSRALDGSLSVTRLAPLPPVATLVPGDAPAIVSAPSGASPRTASVEITLTISTPGSYRIEASSADGSRDAELSLLADGGLVAADSDSGDGNDARIERALEPGSYALRVRDWLNRAASIRVSVSPP